MLEGLVALSSRIRAHHRARTGPSRVTLIVVLAVAAILAAAWLGRFGTHGARVAAISILAAWVLGALVAWVAGRRRWSDPRRSLRREVAGHDPDLAARIDRAAGLVLRARREDAGKEPADTTVSARELSELHLS